MRITKVTTRNGDYGKTNLAKGDVVSKDSLIIKTLGEIDELNSHLGFAISLTNEPNIIDELKSIQNDLFDMGGLISLFDNENRFSHEKVIVLDNRIEYYNSELSPLREFILPGGDQFSSFLHILRTITRRAERSLVSLFLETINDDNNMLKYLNRLSDYFFVLSRHYNHQKGINENIWNR